MPAQKRSLPESLEDGDTPQQRHAKQPHRERYFKAEEEDEEQQEHEEDEDEKKEEEEEEEQGDDGEEDAKLREQDKDKAEDSDETPSSGSEEKSEYVSVELLEIRKDVQCPICLGIIKKTRTVMECLHRFCRECIDKSMRLGNNECPACRTHCASRRSLRDDPKFDALITALYPDIEKYEEEELEFREEEKNRNKLIQASIAKVVQRQSEALVKRRGKDTTGAFVTRSQRNQRNVHSRRQNQVIDIPGSDDNEEDNDNNEKDSSSGDEHCTEIGQRRRKRWTRVRPSQPSSSKASPDGGCGESDMEISRENGEISRHVSKPRKLTWGRGGFRSHTRHGSGSGSNSKSSRNGRLSKLVDYLKSLNENTAELDVHLMLVALDQNSTPSLQQPHLCCRPTLSVKHLCEYVGRQTALPVEEVEILVVKGCCSRNCGKPADEASTLIHDELTALVIDPSKDVEIFREHDSLVELRTKSISKREHLILAYRRKETPVNI